MTFRTIMTSALALSVTAITPASAQMRTPAATPAPASTGTMHHGSEKGEQHHGKGAKMTPDQMKAMHKCEAMTATGRAKEKMCAKMMRSHH